MGATLFLYDIIIDTLLLLQLYIKITIDNVNNYY